MSSTIYLYLKTHNVTNLKYLGKTEQDPHKYLGSGVVWKKHLKKYGNDINTEVLFSSKNIEEIKEMGMYYSNLFNVVESESFANLIEECGEGRPKGSELSKNHKLNISKAKIGHKNSVGINKGTDNPMYGVSRFGNENPFYGKKHSDDARRKRSEVKKGKTQLNTAKRVKVVWKNGTTEMFDSIKECCNSLHISRYRCNQMIAKEFEGFDYRIYNVELKE